VASKHTKSQLGLQIRYHPERDTTELRRQLKAELLTERIQREANSAPPLSIEQRAKIAAILLTIDGDS
jgi:ribosomal protein L29